MNPKIITNIASGQTQEEAEKIDKVNEQHIVAEAQRKAKTQEWLRNPITQRLQEHIKCRQERLFDKMDSIKESELPRYSAEAKVYKELKNLIHDLSQI